MSDIALEFNRVWKKFKKGEKYDSLRDFIPAMAKRLFTGNHREELQKKEFWALKDVSFQVRRGEALGIIGPNGAGKSTILKLLSGILRPNKGTRKVYGRLGALIEVGAGFHPDLTGRENIYLNGAILGMKKIEIVKKFDEIVDFSGISEFIDTPVKRYSSGMYARLGFSIAAHMDPEILLVDEVLSVGDYSFQGMCIKKMNNILKIGTTIIFVSHNIDSVLSLCKRVILLQKGEIRTEGEPGHVVAEYYKTGSSWAPTFVEKKKAFIKSVSLNGIDRAKRAFLPGQHITFEILIEGLESCRLSPGFFLTQDGVSIFATTYSRMIGESIFLNAGEAKRVLWKIDLNLPLGHYDIGVHLEDFDSGMYHEYNFKVASLIVAHDPRYEGKYHLNPVVEIKQ